MLKFREVDDQIKSLEEKGSRNGIDTIARDKITKELIGTIYRGLKDASGDKPDLLKTFIGVLSNRSMKDVSYAYVQLHLYDFDALLQRM